MVEIIFKGLIALVIFTAIIKGVSVILMVGAVVPTWQIMK